MLTITDADGDRQSVKLDVQIQEATGPDSGSIAHVTVNEHGLGDPTDSSETSEALDIPGYTIVEVVGQGAHGQVEKGSDGKWHYTLNEAVDSGKVPGTNTVEGADNVKLVIQDASGNHFTVTVPVDIIDDVPVLKVNGSDYVSNWVESGATVAGKGTLDFDFGADDRGGQKAFTVQSDNRTYDITDLVEKGSYTLESEYGKLTINADGTYSYEAHPNIKGGASDSFVL